jgi:hypothetical protein
MCRLLLPPAQWAQEHFGFAQLGDVRRTRRLVNLATNLAAHPGGTLPQAFGPWAELKAAYRFLERPGVTYKQILAPHLERTRQACGEPGEYLMIEDSTDLSFTHHPATQDLGVIGNGEGRGLALHTALAVRVEAWDLEQRPEGGVVGLFDQQCLCPPRAPRGESREQRLRRPRKTQWWAAGFRWAGSVPAGCQWIYVADRESDFYEPMQRCQQHGVDFLIRAYQDRRLAGGAGRLWEAVAQAPVLGRSRVELRARPGQAARVAQVEIRSVRVDLDGPWRPGGWQAPLPAVTVVEVREVEVPEGVSQPLHWLLLTSLSCRSLAQARRIVGRYTARWWVEEYHKALKSGTGVEDSQLERAYRLEALLAVLAVVAVRLLSTKLLARSQPEGVEAAASFGPEALAILERKVDRPQGGWTNRNVLVATARLGGFIGRKGDGMPGWQTIWRGWHRLRWMCEGLDALREQ